MFIGQFHTALRELYGYGWNLPPATPASPEDKPGRLGDGAAGAPALGGQDPPPGQPLPQRVQPSPEGHPPGNQSSGGQGRTGPKLDPSPPDRNSAADASRAARPQGAAEAVPAVSAPPPPLSARLRSLSIYV